MRIVYFALLLLAVTPPVPPRDGPVSVVGRATKPPVIDGSLEDEAWSIEPLSTTDWLSYDPLYGEKQSQRTEVRATYDERYLYFAFHCFDSEPDKIRTTISRRDNIFNDDWVGLSLDTAGN